jgi:hypothetical protein
MILRKAEKSAMVVGSKNLFSTGGIVPDDRETSFISNLSYDRSTASSKMIPPLNVI